MNVTENMYQYRYERKPAEAIGTCKCCSYKIHEGEEFYELFEEFICEECILDYLKQYRKVVNN